MTDLTLNKEVPNFTAACTAGTDNGEFELAAQRGHNVVLYFYPKDSTPGCTTQGQQFRDMHEAFLAANTKIFGISRDSLKSHHNFKSKMGFPFELIADTDEAVCTLFDTVKMKNMYGKQVRGVERSTFVLDTTGVVRKVWRGVKVPGHVAEVLEFVKTL
ncbi:peroxiredoxin [Parvibium lacunae]|uniref:thioredoxin-dependent peroxiredoxin n=1 Tax=Parvibium lacunae TaxID=1888893 RepID=A0A368L6V8_9BURK|nr:peroxiredoxin [Parvibium lacunae]RCS59383.1 peroxiredoxin [Parvibium lacunae]